MTDTAPDLSEIKVRGLIPQTVLQGTARERHRALIKALLGAPATPPEESSDVELPKLAKLPCGHLYQS